MCAVFDELRGNSHVVIKVVLISTFNSAITSVRNCRLDNTTRLACCLHAKNKIGQIVQAVENTENVHTVVLWELTELTDSVVGIVCIADSVCSTKKHLKGNIGDLISQLLETFPWTLVQETECDIKSGTTPTFDWTQVRKIVSYKWSRIDQILGSNSSCKKGLMRVTHCCVSNEQTVISSNRRSVTLGSPRLENITPTRWWDTVTSWWKNWFYRRWLNINGQVGHWAIHHNFS